MISTIPELRTENTEASSSPRDESQARFTGPHDSTLRATLLNLINSRDALWVRLNFTAEPPTRAGLDLLRETNRTLIDLLGLAPGPNTPTFEPLVLRLEMARCELCTVWIDRAEDETNNGRHPGNSAVVSAAKMFLANENAPLTPNESAHIGYGG